MACQVPLTSCWSRICWPACVGVTVPEIVAALPALTCLGLREAVSRGRTPTDTVALVLASWSGVPANAKRYSTFAPGVLATLTAPLAEVVALPTVLHAVPPAGRACSETAAPATGAPAAPAVSVPETVTGWP